jgi:ABC-2 type transport system ATP-binding protein
MLIIRNFTKRYNDHLVLEIPQLTFGKGASWIKGENGSGKTTLFKSLAGIIPFEGEILFEDGTSLKDNAVAFRMRINYCEAEPLYPGFLTAKDLVRFIGKTRSATAGQQERYCKLLGVNQFFDQPTETFSSGMMKKLALAMAFLGEPKVIILDEPLITLDEQARTTLFQMIREKLEAGVTFLISSHHTITPAELALERIYLLEDKKIQPL